MKKILIIIVLLIITVTSFASDSTHIPINDGPYVSIENDTTVLVQYVSQDSLIAFYSYGNDRISFDGRGFDSLNSYNISTSHETPEIMYENVSRMFVYSDMHGRFSYMCELLENNKIVDSNLNWTFGDGHLVICGDMMDRGDKVTEILWMLYRLEQEAEQVGGKVHFMLGNHEVMVLQNDLRYINEKYNKVAEILDKDSSLTNIFNDEKVLGDWLRSKNICEVINGMMFLHGGMSPLMMHQDYSSKFINTKMMSSIDIPKVIRKSDSTLSHLFGSFGPIWYRGYHYDMEKYKRATMVEIDSLLNYYSVSNIIVGHTIHDSIAVLYGGKIFGVNQDYEIRDEIEGLYIKNGIFNACDINGVSRQIHRNK